jgi:hypothetical protein
MRWVLAPVGVLLLVWLASGDARAWELPGGPGAGHDIVAASFVSPLPGVAGAWVTLAPGACRSGQVVQVRFLYAGESFVVESPLPPCPADQFFVGRALPPAPAGTAPVATHAFVVERPAGSPAEDGFTQRYPGDGFLPAQRLAAPAGPLPGIAWSAADVGVVGGLWAWAQWRDPSRVRALPSRGAPGR